MDYQTLIEQSNHNQAIEREEYNLFSLLKPKIFIDGNQWCVLYGDNLIDGVAGFGDTPYLAVIDWSKAWNEKLNIGSIK
jgi:hypothetical protein